MKRQQERDSPAKGKRSHGSMPRYEDSPRDRNTPDRRDRRGTNKSGEHRRRREPTVDRNLSGARNDGYDDYGRNVKSDRSPMCNYKVLCLSNLNHKISDNMLRDSLQDEFGRFGDVNIKLCHEGNERFALLYFRTCEDARNARRAKSRLILFEQAVHIDPMIDRGGRRNRSMSPEYGGHGARGISPAHSTTSTSSIGRRSGRRNSLERNVPPQFGPRDGGMRRDMRDFHQQHRRDENKKEKFPNYLHHVPPEEDDKATRTLFVGNLEVTISEQELRRIFERYGVVEDIDVKRPPPGQGNAYAFIKFLNLDMAHRAKVEMSGQYIGKFQCKIGYGKATPTTRIWVGGLGTWTSLSHLEREFDRFGAIRKIDFVKGENHAYIQYDSIDAAQAACQEMRGFPLGGPDKRLRVDFADPGPYSTYFQSPSGYQEEPFDAGYYESEGPWPRNSSYGNQQYDGQFERPNRREQWQSQEGDDRGRADFGGWNRDRQGWLDNHGRSRDQAGNERRKRPRTPDDDSTHDKRRHLGEGTNTPYKYVRARTPEAEHDKSGNKGISSPQRNRDALKRTNRDHVESHSAVRGDGLKGLDSREVENEGVGRNNSGKTDKDGGVCVAESVSTIQELAKCCPVVWHGGLVLKNSSFPSRMLLCSGDPSLVETLMRDPSGDTPILRITQRLRLDPPKLEDVLRRITNAGPQGYCILLTLSGSTQIVEDQGNPVQQRPLRNLVSYLKQKEAAGVIPLPCTKKDVNKELSAVLYAFPPCQFALDVLRKIAPNLAHDNTKEDHIVVVVVRGT